MKKIITLCAVAILHGAFPSHAGLITGVPTASEQGAGMIMPMVMITNADNNMNPTSGTLALNFNPLSTPILSTLETWSPGSWFADTASWRADLGSPLGVGGTPAANVGSGQIFNSQYGFTFSSNPMMGMANQPAGKSLALKLTAMSSSAMESYNYGETQNRWDRVFSSIGSQVLWNGGMWHNYFTMPAAAAAGTYTASFEVFISNTPFTGTTGYAQYDPAALGATADLNFVPTTINYTWTVVPEPSALATATSGIMLVLVVLRRRMKANG